MRLKAFVGLKTNVAVEMRLNARRRNWPAWIVKEVSESLKTNVVVEMRLNARPRNWPAWTVNEDSENVSG